MQWMQWRECWRGGDVSPGHLIDPWSGCGIYHLRLILHFTILPFIPSSPCHPHSWLLHPSSDSFQIFPGQDDIPKPPLSLILLFLPFWNPFLHNCIPAQTPFTDTIPILTPVPGFCDLISQLDNDEIKTFFLISRFFTLKCFNHVKMMMISGPE